MIKFAIDFVTGWWLSLHTHVFSTNKTDHHDITDRLLKVALNTIKPTNQIETNKPKSNQNN
jgi:hypothetical protein